MTPQTPMPLLPARRPQADRFGVLFVCLGNICRSPMAEAIFIHRARERGVLPRLDIDSCGLGEWHVGGPADPRTIAACRKRGVAVPSIARLWDPGADPARFDVVIPMDSQNVRGLLTRGAARERIRKMRLFEGVRDSSSTQLSATVVTSDKLGPTHNARPSAASNPRASDLLFADAAAIPDVPDPYTGPDSGFDTLFEMLDLACTGLLKEVERVL